MGVVSRSVFPLLLFILVLNAPGSIVFGYGAPPPPVYLAQGVVRDEQGLPVAGAVVAVQDAIAMTIVPKEPFEVMKDLYDSNRKKQGKARVQCSDGVGFTDDFGEYCIVLSGPVDELVFYKPGYRLGRLAYPRDVSSPDSCGCSCAMQDLEMARGPVDRKVVRLGK